MPTYSLAAEVIGGVAAFALVAAAVAGVTVALERHRLRQPLSPLARALDTLRTEREEADRG